MSEIEYMEEPVEDKKLNNILTPTFKKWFFNKFDDFTLPQKYSVYTIHSRENILVSAPTGSGKTLSAFGAVLNELVDLDEKDKLKDQIYCVYVSPLKALSNDIRRNLIEPLEEIKEQEKKESKIRIGLRTGDTTQYEKAKMAKNPPHILITTPESLAIMLASPKFRENFRAVEWLIVDEIHSLAENKRGAHLSLTMERLQKLSPGITRVGLSATVAPLEEVAKFLVGERKCKIVDVQFIKEYDFQVVSPVDDLINVSQEQLHENMYRMIDNLIQQHKTTLIFTNTRAGTERVVHHLKDKFPKKYYADMDKEDARSLIGAHHGSLSKDHRLKLENDLKAGKLKAVVCSTSLELGIDIGFVDLVICLGSPKSVARLLQRAGRAGHSLQKMTKARIIVLDRDDLIECSVMLKAALEKKIDRIHIPTNSLDVLAQHIVGMAVEEVWEEKDMFETIRKSYCYKDLERKDFEEILQYLSGEFVSLQERYVFAKIWRKDGKIGKRGRMTRVIYMTNIGTIPDETSIKVKIGDMFIGTIEEGFLEKLKPGDIFVLGGNIYQFKHARGMTVQVSGSVSRPPTVPSWVSEQLPLSFDLALSIGKFRRLMEEKFETSSRQDILDFIHDYLYVDKKAAEAIYRYMREQYQFCHLIPNDKKILVEHYDNEDERKIIFHTLYGRRINDCLSRAIAFSLSLTQKRDVEVGISDNGFYITFTKPINVMAVINQLSSENLRRVMDHAIDKSETYKRRFRHCATRALMILRNYMGREKKVGKQQMASMILMKALRDLDPNFSILKEAKREVLEDLMDIDNTKLILSQIENKEITFEEIHTKIPSPFAFQLVLQGHLDILKMEDKIEFLKRMHSMVLAKISVSKESKNVRRDLLDDSENIIKERGSFKQDAVDTFLGYENEEDNMHEVQKRILQKARKLRTSYYTQKQLIEIIKGKPIEKVNEGFIERIRENKEEMMKDWPKELADFVLTYLNKREDFDPEKYFEGVANNPNTSKELKKEELIENIKLLSRRMKLDDDLKYDLIDTVDKGKVSDEAKDFIRDFVKNTIPKYVTDDLFYHFKNIIK